MRPQRQLWRNSLTAAIAAIALTGLALPAPAFAQDADVDELPSGPPEEGETSESGGGLDLSGVITVDEDGNIFWNVETETDQADPGVSEPTTAPDGGIAGTGDSTTSTDDPTGTSDDADETSSSGAGSNLALVFAILGGLAVLGVAAVFLFRMRKQKQEELEQVEDVIDPLANERLAGEFPEPAYAGADEAGAYEEGGAAYAQYTDGTYAAGEAADKVDAGTRLDQIRASMVDLADRGLADTGHDRLVAKKLEAAGSQMRPGEWLVMTIAGTVGAFFGGVFLFGPLLGGFIAAITALGFWMYLSARESSRQRAFEESLPETLQLIAGSLRGGLSMMQAIQTVADEADAPTAEEFQRIITETRLGRDLAVSFRDLAGRMGSKDFEWVVTAIEIHREVGGDLAGILDRVGDTIRARNRVRGQVKALSAEGKLSGLILFVLPPGMVAAISVLNRAYLNEMLDTSEGQIMLVVSGVLLIAGGVWLKRLARFVY